ncbi:lysosomal-associated transmembrane protein 4B-like [Dama dama]|uniref:lysosomal-associated transmembrane protein 4B-like n=1 Tax=Dama dama TaxID=30532 RepID=UPI002A35E9D3|nr:lysosomal-associated transmembrane protein 4B-like [Dama dama]
MSKPLEKSPYEHYARSQIDRDASSSLVYHCAGSLSDDGGGPRTLFSSNSGCLCCRVLAGTILPGTRYLIFNAVALLALLSALADPDQYHSSSSELGGDFEFMDDVNMCIAITISVLMVLIWAAAVHGAYKQHVTRIIPSFCYQIFGFALNTLVAVTVLVYPSSIQEYIRQLPPNFPHKDDIMSVNPICLVLIIFLFISIILTVKDYLISCVWNFWAYISGRNSSDALDYVISSDAAVLLPPTTAALTSGGPALTAWVRPRPQTLNDSVEQSFQQSRRLGSHGSGKEQYTSILFSFH